ERNRALLTRPEAEHPRGPPPSEDGCRPIELREGRKPRETFRHVAPPQEEPAARPGAVQLGTLQHPRQRQPPPAAFEWNARGAQHPPFPAGRVRDDELPEPGTEPG